MEQRDLITLGIESSCDETSISVLKGGREVLSNIISSQIDIHKTFGGVVPEIASRKHVEVINQIIDEALREAKIEYKDIDIVAATRGPGLIGALLVGLNAAKAMAYALKKPLVPINHILGHVCANYISNVDLEPPFISLIVSGGHTYLVKVVNYCEVELIGETRDDAAGEAFDKVARSLGIGYPGGPLIDKLAKEGEDNLNFPRVMLEENSYDFSFSGLKTAVLNYLNGLKMKDEDYVLEDVCASFQSAVVDVLVEKSFRLVKEEGMDKIVISGGVAANSGLREAMESRGEVEGVKIYYPDKILCTDNAAMIASAGYYTYLSGKYNSEEKAKPNLSL